MSEARVNNLSNESNTGGPTISGITTSSGTNFFVPPVGSTGQRPDNPQKGAIRFNTDTKHLEYYRGDTIGWSEVEASHGQLGGGAGSNTGTGVRGVVPGGNGTPDGTSESMTYITISTLGNGADFGDMLTGINANAGGASRTRGLSLGGSFIPARQSTIEYFTFASLGSAADYGDLSVARAELGCATNQVRAVAAGGSDPSSDSDVIDYGTIASTGTFKDFGDLTDNRESVGGGISIGTRGIFYGGQSPAQNTIEYIIIMTTGNSTDFGDSLDTEIRRHGCSNSTRGLIAGSNTPTTNLGIEYLTTATLGNSIDFGDLTLARRNMGAVASPTRSVFMGGQLPSPSPAQSNVLDYVEFATTGNAVDFGDLNAAGSTNGVMQATGASSNGHGGL